MAVQKHKVRTVGDLKRALANFPDDMLIAVEGEHLAGKAEVQEGSVYPPVRKRGPYTAAPEGMRMPCERVCFVTQPE